MDILYKYKKIIELLLLFIILIIISLAIKYYFKPFWSAIILFIICMPVYKALIKLSINKSLAGIISILSVNVLMVMAITLMSKYFYTFITSSMDDIKSIFVIVYEKYEYVFEMAKKIKLTDALSIIKQNNLGGNVNKIGTQLFAYFVGNITCYFFLTERQKIKEVLNKVLTDDVVEKFSNQKNNMMKMVSVEIYLVIVTTIEIAIGLYILRVDNFFLLSILCGILDILPYVGTILVFLPLVIYSILCGNYIISIGLILLYILSQIIRQVLEAKLLSKKFKIHPIIVFISIYIAMQMLGIVGIIIGPIYCIIAKDFILGD